MNTLGSIWWCAAAARAAVGQAASAERPWFAHLASRLPRVRTHVTSPRMPGGPFQHFPYPDTPRFEELLRGSSARPAQPTQPARLAAPGGEAGRSSGPRTDAIVYMMVKAPVPGFVKTRLCPPLSPGQAAGLASAFAKDTLERLAAQGGAEARVALDERRPGDGDAIRALAAAAGVTVEEQGDGDLGARMARLLERGLGQGRPTMLVGTDSPDMPAALVAEAVDALRRADAVMVPAHDGGYVLVGARRRIDGLFEIPAPWGSDGVFAATCDALARAGCTFVTLAPWEDVDDAAALGRLALRLASGGVATAPATAHLLDLWRGQGVRF